MSAYSQEEKLAGVSEAGGWEPSTASQAEVLDAGGGSRLRHSRYVTVQLAEAAVSRYLFKVILWLID